MRLGAIAANSSQGVAGFDGDVYSEKRVSGGSQLLYRYSAEGTGLVDVRYDVTGVVLTEDENGWYQPVAIPWREV